MHLKMSSGKWQPFCLGLYVLTSAFDLTLCGLVPYGVWDIGQNWRHQAITWTNVDLPSTISSLTHSRIMFASIRKMYITKLCIHNWNDKQRVLMHRHQGWNVRHGLCHIYMRYLYIYELFIAFVCFVVCSLLQRDGIFGVLCRKWQARESTGMFGNLMAIYYIIPQFIQNHSRFVMLMKTCMIS